MPRKPKHAERHPRKRPVRPYAGKDAVLKLRITSEEKSALEAHAVAIDVSTAEYVRRLVRLACGMPTVGVSL